MKKYILYILSNTYSMLQKLKSLVPAIPLPLVVLPHIIINLLLLEDILR